MDRSNHYEAAFEGYLQWYRLPYVAIDESRRSFLGDERVKSLDFIVHSEHSAKWLIDVKGRRYPGGSADRPHCSWECWSTREDIDSLQQWAERFGPDYRPLLVFMYQIMPFAPAVPEGEDLWTWHDRRYLLRAILVEQYRESMRRRSEKWGTVSLPIGAFRRLSQPFYAFLHTEPSTMPYGSGMAFPDS